MAIPMVASFGDNSPTHVEAEEAQKAIVHNDERLQPNGVLQAGL